jgi:class 3 adenylate cyclase
LFCDLIDSTGHQYRMEAEDFAALLACYRRLAIDCVARHGGHVARLIGDGVLAYFGWPRGGGRDAEAAVSCALAIGEGIGLLDARETFATDRPVAVRMAVETGWVLVGNVAGSGGGHALEQGDVIGHAPNVAAKLQRLALPNGVVAGEATLALLGDRFEVEIVDSSALELPAPVRAARVLRRSPAGEALLRLGAGRDRLLLGRAEELAALMARWQEAAGGRGQVLLLSGEPGIGKSTLAAALVAAIQQAAGDRPPALLVLSCAAAMIDSALQPLAEPLRLLMDLPVGADAAEIERAAARLASRLGMPSGAIGLAATLGVTPAGLEPAALRNATFQALLELAGRLAADRPLLVLTEDLQWADPSTLDLLRLLGERAAGLPILLVGTHHAGWTPPWPDAAHLHHLPLAPLSSEAADALLAALDAGMEQEVRATIVARSEGNPFFMREFARSLAQEAAPAANGRRGRTAPRLPGSISQLLAARLDSAGAARFLVQFVSVVGRDVEAAFLALLADLPPPALEAELARLTALGILQRRGEGSAARIGFQHSLLAAASYEALTSQRRQTLHRRVAEALPQHDPAIRRSEPEVLARHLALAGESEAAAELFQAAAANALASAAFVESAAHARRALELAAQMAGETAQRARLSATVLLGEALSGTQGYASEAVHALFETANRIALELGGAADLMQPALRGLTAFYQLRGPLHRAYELGRRTVQVARQKGDALLLAEAERRWGWCRFCQGELEEARLLVESAMMRIERAQAARDEPPSPARVFADDTVVRGPVVLGLVAWFVEGDAAAIALAERLTAAARQFPQPMTAAYGLGFAAIIEQLCGRTAQAEACARRCGEIARGRSSPYWASLADTLRGWSAVAGGEMAGLTLLRQGVADYAATQSLIMYPYALMLRADAERAVGATETALATLQEAMACMEAIGAEVYRPLLQAARGRILMARDPAAAAQAWGEAREACRRQGALAQMRRVEQAAAEAPTG